MARVKAVDVGAISAALGSADAEERRQATARLGGAALDAALPLLVRALGDGDWRVRKEATLAARAFTVAPELVAAMIGQLRSPPEGAANDDVGLRNAAVEVLAGAGRSATAALAIAMGTLDADGRKLAVEALGRGGDPAALAPLEAALADGDDNVRAAVIEAIGLLGAAPRPRVHAILLASLEDRDPLVRLGALEGLRALAAPIPWDRLAPLLDDPTLRPMALSAASLCEHPEAASALARALQASFAPSGSGKPGHGRAFGQVLAALARLAEGPLAEPTGRAVRAEGPELGRRLTELAADVDAPPGYRSMALRLAAAARLPSLFEVAFAALADEQLADPARLALRTLGPGALPEMVRRLADAAGAPPGARAELVDVIADLASPGRGDAADEAVLAALRDAMRDADRVVASGALSALARVGAEEDLALLAAETLFDPRPGHEGASGASSLRSWPGGGVAVAAEGALSALAARWPEAARAQAERMMPRADEELPAALVLGALAVVGEGIGADDVAFLARVAATGESRARRAAVLAVAEIGGAAAMEVLSVALTDEAREVQLAAARALGRRCVAIASPSPREILDFVERSGPVELVAATLRAIGEGLTPAYPDRRSAPPPPASPELIEALSRAARGAPSLVALAAVDALGHAIAAGSVAAAPALAAALEHPDGPTARAAAFRLGDTPRGRAALGLSLEHASPSVRLHAVETLAEVDPAGARDLLARRAMVERDAAVLDALDRALSPSSRPSGERAR